MRRLGLPGARGAALLVTITMGCDGKSAATDSGDGGAADGGAADGGAADGGAADGGAADGGDTSAGPCPDGGFGALSEAARDEALFVAVDGDDGAAGTLDAPLATLAEALVRTEDSASATILVGPGTFTTTAAAYRTAPGVTLRVAGCGTDELAGTVLVGGEDAPVLAIHVDAFHLSDVRTRGGRQALVLAGEAATVERVAVAEAVRAGIVVQGSDTILTEVEVSDLVPEAGTTSDGAATEVGIGVSIDGAAASLAQVHIRGATAVGLLAEAATLDISGLIVEAVTADSSGRLGRGVQLQGFSHGVMAEVEVHDAVDAGLVLVDPDLVTLEDVRIDSVAGATFEGGEGPVTTGDGVVVTQSGGLDPTLLSVSMQRVTVAGAARAGLILDGVTAASLDALDTADSGVVDSETGVSTWVQGGASVATSSVAWVEVDEAFELDRAGLPPETSE